MLACFRLRGITHAFGSSAAQVIMHSASHFKSYSSGYMQSQKKQCTVSDLCYLNLNCLSRRKRCKTVLELQSTLANAAADMATVLKQASFQLDNMH